LFGTFLLFVQADQLSVGVAVGTCLLFVQADQLSVGVAVAGNLLRIDAGVEYQLLYQVARLGYLPSLQVCQNV